jgi:16S rRNA (guanine527-N7)-methyltransferase
MDLILKYFPHLTHLQISQFSQLKALYTDWNSKINVISRKDIDELYERHVLHALGIAKIHQFLPQIQVMDVGTGGGFSAPPDNFIIFGASIVDQLFNSTTKSRLDSFYRRSSE